MACNARFQICDRGYHECQLEIGHDGDHQYTYNGASFPDRNYKLTWEVNPIKDFIVTKEWLLNETNFLNIINNISDKFDTIVKTTWYFEDDAIYGDEASVWISLETNMPYPDFNIEKENTEIEEAFFNYESDIHRYIDDSIKEIKTGRTVIEYKMHFHVSLYPLNTLDTNNETSNN